MQCDFRQCQVYITQGELRNHVMIHVRMVSTVKPFFLRGSNFLTFHGKQKLRENENLRKLILAEKI